MNEIIETDLIGNEPESKGEKLVDLGSLDATLLRHLGSMFEELSLPELKLIQLELKIAMERKRLKVLVNEEVEMEPKQLLQELADSIVLFSNFYVFVTMSKKYTKSLKLKNVANKIGNEAMSLSNFIKNTLKAKFEIPEFEFQQIESKLVTYTALVRMQLLFKEEEKDLPIELKKLSQKITSAVDILDLIFSALRDELILGGHRVTIAFRQDSLKVLLKEIRDSDFEEANS